MVLMKHNKSLTQHMKKSQSYLHSTRKYGLNYLKHSFFAFNIHLMLQKIIHYLLLESTIGSRIYVLVNASALALQKNSKRSKVLSIFTREAFSADVHTITIS